MKKNTKPEDKPSKPFFARFLETQDLSKAGAGATLKYPSDSDEEWRP